MTEPFTFAEGDMVRIGREPGIVKRIRLNGECDVWTSYGLRTVDSNLLGPAKRGDTVLKAGMAAPDRKKGVR